MNPAVHHFSSRWPHRQIPPLGILFAKIGATKVTREPSYALLIVRSYGDVGPILDSRSEIMFSDTKEKIQKGTIYNLISIPFTAFMSLIIHSNIGGGDFIANIFAHIMYAIPLLNCLSPIVAYTLLDMASDALAVATIRLPLFLLLGYPILWPMGIIYRS